MKLSTSNIHSILFILCCSLVSCQENKNNPPSIDKVDTVAGTSLAVAENTSPKDSAVATKTTEDKILDTIFKLPEVKDRQQYIEQQTKGERHLKVWFSTEPTAADKFYSVNVGEDNGSNLVTHFQFKVYTDSMRIMYYDVPNDSLITLQQWRNK